MTPQYLSVLLPPQISTLCTYPLRNSNQLRTPACNTVPYSASFLPSTIRLWNNLSQQHRNSETISKFKTGLFKFSSASSVPPYYYLGNRSSQIIHTKLRHNKSSLNAHKLFMHISDNPSCSCGHPLENAEHYLLYCRNHTLIRNQTINLLLPEQKAITSLLFGNNDLSAKTNSDKFNTVHNFIDMSKPFEY